MSRPSPTQVRRRRQALVAVGLTLLPTALGSFAVAPSSAWASSVEQVSRASGANGASSFFAFQAPVFASDSGRFAVLRKTVTGADGLPSGFRFEIRDTVLNTTRRLGNERVVAVSGLDRSELWAVATLRPAAAGEPSQVVLLSTIGLPSRTLFTLPADDPNAYVAISGNGRKVAVAGFLGGLTVIDVATRKATTLTSDRIAIGPRSLSDDGRTVTGEGPNGRGVAFVDGARVELGNESIVSPDGSVLVHTAHFEDPASKVTVRRVATGATTTFGYPAGVTYLDLLWIAVDGKRLIASATTPEGVRTAQQLDLTTGTWSPIAGPFGDTLARNVGLTEWDLATNPVSRNGRYAVLGYTPLAGIGPRQTALVNLSGGGLPGVQEALSASSYVGLTPPARSCEPATDGALLLQFAQPAPWIGRPRSAQVDLAFDSGETVSQSFTEASPAGADDTPPPVVTVPAAATKLTVRASVVDATGRTVTSTETTPVACTR